MTCKNILNHAELYSLLYQGDTNDALKLFRKKCSELNEVNTRNIRLYLSSINYGIYNYILFQEGVSLHESCYKNDKLIWDCTKYNYLEIGEKVIESYGEGKEYLVEKHSNEHIKRGVSYIHKNLSSPLTLRKVCEEISLNPCYFSNLFRKEVGMTFCEYVLNQRVTLAKRLLRTTNLSVELIASKCGFLQVSYFCTSFKKVVGMTPVAYRG